MAAVNESQWNGAVDVASTRQSKDDMIAANQRAAAVQHDSPNTTLLSERTTTVYHRNDIEELREALFEIGSIQKREESCETDVPIVPCCDVINGATRKSSLLEAQEIGEKKLQVMVFPLFSTHGREVWSYVMFLLLRPEAP